MGQAKNRGTLQVRIEQAKTRIDAIRPKKIICNDCKGEINEITDLDVRGLIGIRGAFAGICPKCKSSTFAIDGDPEKVVDFMMAFEASMGKGSEIGIQTRNGEPVEE